MWRGWVRQRCHVSCVTRAPNWYWLTDGQVLQQVWVEQDCFYFFFVFTFHSFSFLPCPSLSSPLCSPFSSTISSISVLPFSGRWHKMSHKGWCVIKPHHNHSTFPVMFLPFFTGTCIAKASPEKNVSYKTFFALYMHLRIIGLCCFWWPVCFG